jgi:uncharacterized glyoxalase superfamily protein PhnB
MIPAPNAHSVIPILCVRDFNEAVAYYTEKLLFRKLWDWEDPPTFGAVALGSVEIFFCLQGQGNPGAWLSIFIDDVDAYYESIRATGAEVLETPANKPWGMREMLVRDPNQHILRFGHGIPMSVPKLEIERVPLTIPLEKRLAALLEDLCAHKQMTLTQVIEETLLHTFEKVPSGGVASPHTERTLAWLKELKKKHGIDYDTHASYRFVEKERK